MVSVLALTVLIIPLAQANDSRTRAQTAADAAALGAVTALRDQAIMLAQNGTDPTGLGLWSVAPDIDIDDPIYNQRARKFANSNGASLTAKTEPSGTLGHTMKVSVRSNDCILKKDEELTAEDREDIRLDRDLCTDPTGKKGKPKSAGNAIAVAKLILPECTPEFENRVGAPGAPGAPDDGVPVMVRLVCDGQPVWEINRTYSRAAISPLFKSRLVAKEDAQKYTGLPPIPPGAGGPIGNPGELPPGTSAMAARAIAQAQRWLGLPYSWGGGTVNGPSTGICCSPGGHDARNTVGFDCSSLVQNAWFAAGINLPRVTTQQIRAGRLIPPGQEKPGDLIFPHSGHVGLVYNPANRSMIHAPQTGDVVRYGTYSYPPLAFIRPYSE